ncbi:MAG: hypothetical protein RL088_109 [Verrucomicrobiota bacterium]|jgi:hypothetical protein
MSRQTDGRPSPRLDYLANGFEAKGFADDLASMGVDYVIFTAWHSNVIPLFNSSAVVKNFEFQPNASRDMIGEMVTAVKAKGIRVLLYPNIGQVSVHFDGTGVIMVGNGLGEIDFSLDEKPVKRVNMNASGNRPGVVGIDLTGTGIQFLAPQGPGGATIEVFLDGESVRNVNQYHPMPLGTAPLFTLTGLSVGRHTLCLVKKRGAWMSVEAFRVFNPTGK